MNNGVFNFLAFVVLTAVTIAFTGAWFAPLVVAVVAFASLAVMSVILGLGMAIQAKLDRRTLPSVFERFKAFLKTIEGQALFIGADNLVLILLIVTFPHALPLLTFDFAVVVALTRTAIGLLRLQIVKQKAVPA